MNRRARSVISWLVFLAAGSPALVSEPAQPIDPEHLDFFERHVRPVLVDSCYPCHSLESGKAKGGLRVDSAAALREGGDRGPAVVPGRLDSSWLITAVCLDDPDLQMPPASHGRPLDVDKIEQLKAWVAMGAPDPRIASLAPSGSRASDSANDVKSHWAFQPVVEPKIPHVHSRQSLGTPLDAFVLANLETLGLRPARPAEPRTLLRRVSYDLIGLPPSPEEMDAFLADPSPEAYEQVVRRLLASPHYGERWGRHWLDIARYADTKGYVFQEERRFPYAYTYRDYVIRAFNEDKGYDRFLLEQLAADQLEPGEDRSALAAMGFLTLGRRFLNNQNDIIDDRIDVVTRGTLGLTVSCARCHDHKFDPISKEDYYALHGVFASSQEPEDKPLLATLERTDDYQDYLKQREMIESEIANIGRREVDETLREIRRQSGEYLFAALEFRRMRADVDIDDFAGTRKLIPLVLRRWVSYLEQNVAAPDPVLLPGLFVAMVLENVPTETPTGPPPPTKESSVQWLPGNTRVSHALAAKSPQSLQHAAEVYNAQFTDADDAWEEALQAAAERNLPSPTSLANPDQEAIRRLLYAADSPANPPRQAIERLISRQIRNATVKHRQRIEALTWTHPGAPPRAMVLQDKPSPANSRVFLRGNPHNPGREVPRRFLSVLAGPEPVPFTQGSGRLELAQAIANADNPLTARVFVNRVWAWHFGQALVDSPSDFGVRTEAPLQRDLLDWLAARFMADGWSIKSLHRLIVLSNTYRQSSRPSPGTLKEDPDNRYLGRFNRQRLDFEAMRDTLLVVADRLDPTLGGQPVDITSEKPVPRRTVYGFIDRQNLPGMFRTFDFANPDTSRPGRFQTTVPQQALFLMNSPFVIEQARALARRSVRPGIKSSTEQRIEALYRMAYQREPAPEETRLARDFLTATPSLSISANDNDVATSAPEPYKDNLGVWEQFAQILLLSNELMFVD